jgi:hypothetical protein
MKTHLTLTAFAAFALTGIHAEAAPVSLVTQAPVEIKQIAPGHYFIDFGKVAFANIALTANSGATGNITVHFGEKLTQNGRIDRKPPGTVRYATSQADAATLKATTVAPAPDQRNTTHPSAVLTPKEWGVVLPFRWVEIEGWSGPLEPENIQRRAAFLTAWKDDAAHFESSDPLLNRIWDLSKYSIKATTFAGVYVDGDRERIPYEADAYLNQLSHYYTDSDRQIARDTYDFLMEKPTWPTEWAPHMVFMAHADWMHTGDAEWLRPRYEKLKTKLLLGRAGEDGLIRSNGQQIKRDDIVDWPAGERDGYQFTAVNTVVNAFHLAALKRMADIARATGNDADATTYDQRFSKTLAAFNQQLLLSNKGIYRDGIGTDHASLHANLFPLAFGLVPQEHIASVRAHLVAKGMRCSVYAAQYLLEAFFENGAHQEALALITADGDRSWKHMVNSGTTISWEAWDQKYKPNQDWNHAWGAAPANLFPRYLLGAEPATPGWKTTRIRPFTANLKEAKGTIPTPHGPILIHWKTQPAFAIQLDIPAGTSALIDLPAPPNSRGVFSGTTPIPAKKSGNRWILEKPLTGQQTLTVR